MIHVSVVFKARRWIRKDLPFYLDTNKMDPSTAVFCMPILKFQYVSRVRHHEWWMTAVTGLVLVAASSDLHGRSGEGNLDSEFLARRAGMFAEHGSVLRRLWAKDTKFEKVVTIAWCLIILCIFKDGFRSTF